MCQKKINGMTMVEMVFSLLFFCLIISAAFMLCKTGWDSWALNSARVMLVEEFRRIQGWITLDLSQSGVLVISDVPADGSWYHDITFQRGTGIVNGAIVWGPVSSYSLGGSGGGKLLRTVDGVSNPVSGGLTNFDVRRQTATPNLVEFHVAVRQATGRLAGESKSMSFDFQVQMRN